MTDKSNRIVTAIFRILHLLMIISAKFEMLHLYLLKITLIITVLLLKYVKFCMYIWKKEKFAINISKDCIKRT